MTRPSPTTTVRTGALAITVGALLLLAGTLLWHTTGDLDLLLHDRTGEDILAGQGIPDRNGYSFTAPDHRWTDHEWLFQVMIAATGRLTGSTVVAERNQAWSWLRLVLGLLLVVFLMLAAWRHHRGPPAALVAAVGTLGLALLWTRLTLRPELVSYILVVVVVDRVESALRQVDGRRWWQAVLDPRGPAGQVTWLAWFWSQCHGFAAMVPVVWLLAAILDRPGTSVRSRWRLAGAGAAATLVVGALTPNGLAGLTYPLQVLAQFGGDGPDLQRTISELVPLLETRGSLASTLLMFKVSLAWGAVWVVLRSPRLSLLRIVLWVLAALAAWQSQRSLGIYAVAFVMLHAGPLAERTSFGWRLARRWAERVPARVHAIADGVATMALWVVIAVWVAAVVSDRFYLGEGVGRRFGRGLTPATYPLAATEALGPRHPERIANSVDAASTIIHSRVGPVAIDGRTEAYPAATWREYAEFRAGGETTRRRLDRWRADAVCLAHRNSAAHPLIAALREDPRWRLVSADEAGVAFTRRPTAEPGDPRPILSATSDRLARRLAGPLAAGDIALVDETVAWANLLTIYGQDPVARELLERAVAAVPDHPLALHNLGNQLMAAGELEAALRRFEASARLNRNSAPPLVNAGNCLFRMGRLREAAASFEQAVARDPSNFQGWANLAEARRQLGDRQGAGAAYRRALALRPGDQRLRERARTLGR
jgi:hypothetical protein